MSVSRYLVLLENPWLPPLYMVLIFGLSSIPGVAQHGEFNILMHINSTWQNMLHIPLFGGLQLLWLSVFNKYWGQRWQHLLLGFVLTVGYGVLDEFHQYFVAGRYASLSDIFHDAIGALVGIGVFLLLQKNAANWDGES